MNNLDQEFLKRIQETFRIEAKEHLQSFTERLIELEKNQSADGQAGIIEILFREVHSLKGAARSVGQKDIESVCQPMESLFSALKRHDISLSSAAVDLIYKGKEVLSTLILTGELSQVPGGRQYLRELSKQLIEVASAASEPEIKEEVALPIEIKPIESPQVIPSAPLPEISSPPVILSKPEPQSVQVTVPDEPVNKRAAFAEVVRIPISKLDPLLLQAEEFLQSKIMISQHTNELNSICGDIKTWKTQSVKWSGRRAMLSPGQWKEWQDENESRLNKLETHLNMVTKALEKDMYTIERMVNDHLDDMKQVLMLPVATLVEVFPGMVREISRNQQKEIDFIIRGSELEIDKRILEDLKDPLIHLIRNSIDHGIGTPRERELQHKPPRGKINLSFTAKDSGLVEIIISDDGKGINTEKVLKAALKLGIITPEHAEKLTHDEILALILHSGVSTSPIITDLSGRGLGMSIVREKVENMNGRLFIETTENQGTTFRILMPMTLATFRGTVVSVDEMVYILPTMNVDRVMRVKSGDITTIENYETICIDEAVLSVVSLSEVLGLPQRPKIVSRTKVADYEHSDHVKLVVLVTAENRMAFKVDEVLDEHQILVKGLGKLLKRVRNISGATILGSGKVVPVLHVSDLMKSALQTKAKFRGSVGEEKTEQKIARILVAEDSITSRTMLKNILETAGYLVTVAVDGSDAFNKARNDEFDLVLSDVDMPKMNGFELTLKIKNDAKLGDIPVVLCTSLESREDKERGIEAGADAYIVKNSFDQGNLLEIIKRLI